MNKAVLSILAASAALTLGCDPEPVEEGPVNFESEGAQELRKRVCELDWSNVANKGSATDSNNATLIWSVSPYRILVPNTGRGYAKLNVDAPHYDWLIYTTSDVQLDAMDGPAMRYNGPVEECPDKDLVEYGAHQPEIRTWMLELDGQAGSQPKLYAGLAATDHSNPEDAGHAGHELDGDAHAPDHGGH